MSTNDNVEDVLYEEHPAMFRNRPVYFVFCCLLIAAFGIGLVMLLIWYFQSIGTTLIITEERTTLRRGVFSKYTNEVTHDNVRNVQIAQTFLQRIMGVGNVGISSAGQSGVEIFVRGIPDPERVREIIHNGSRGEYEPD
ncbi:Bacterial membrane flanked domain protein [Symmachiella dynata]|uniref:Bacterial membrane flanked domain protein n=1 Tax=Symmachiella dynata TaxID=2527995 RepID=A0A517ZTG2_9PLAN|nr:PH domain-containing protein [Symmachiella dynata]QDU45733.1 Bacterial membrane flanked domain protein [Symmachiella dynata]